MYINWFHHYTPKVFGCLAFIVNPIFVYLVFTDKKANLGNYRYLLTYFAFFNVMYSIMDILVPVGVHGYRYCFFIFITDGLFVEGSDFNHYMLSFRCSMVSCSYAILITHFVYRYLAIHKSDVVNRYFLWYMLASFLLCVFYFAFWCTMCELFLYGAPDIKAYIHDNFRELYGGNSTNLNIVTSIYREGVEADVIRSWQAIVMLSVFSVCTISFYFFMGHKIMSKLSCASLQMSRKTADLQKTLFKALAIQTIIPICVSFLPCLLCWYAPALMIDMGRTINYTGVIALAIFPSFDPVAIICCLPVLRNRIVSRIVPVQPPSVQTNSSST